MRSQSKGIGSADISASTYDKIRTIPARLHCASHWQDNAAVQARPSAQREGVAWNRLILIEAPSSAYHGGMLRVAKPFVTNKELPIRPIRFQLSEFQVAHRE